MDDVRGMRSDRWTPAKRKAAPSLTISSAWAAETLRLRAVRSSRALIDRTLGSSLEPGLSAEELRVLASSRLDSIAYLLFESDNPVQRLYDRIWQAQCAAISAFLDSAKSRGLQPLPVQGVEKNRRYLAGHAFNRRGDLDFLVLADEVEALASLLREQGFSQAAVAADQGLKPISAAGMADALRKSGMAYERGYPFLKAIPFDAEPELLRLVPSLLAPVRRTNAGVELILAIDLMTAYIVGKPISKAWRKLRPSAFEQAQTLAAELELLFTAYRLCRKMEVKSLQLPLTRLLAEMVLVIAAEDELDWDLIARARIEYGLGLEVVDCIAVAAALAGPCFHSAPGASLDPWVRSFRCNAHSGWSLEKLFPLGILGAELGEAASLGRSQMAESRRE